jgi:hypothetical protein
MRSTTLALAIIVLCASLRDAQATCGQYGRYHTYEVPQTVCDVFPGPVTCTKNGWVFGSTCSPQDGGRCGSYVTSGLQIFNCADESYSFAANDTYTNLCPCDPNDAAIIAKRADGAMAPGAYGCTDASCLTASPEPEVCDGVEAPDSTPSLIDEGCGQDEHQCSASGDADGAPTRFSSGRVESNPLELFTLNTPENIFFGYRLQWNSMTVRAPARARRPPLPVETQPTIHHQDEETHFVGRGWIDNFGDRLYVNVHDKPLTGAQSDRITWQNQNGTVTFSANNGWKSFSGKYELVDRGTNSANWGDNFGRWVVRTTDDRAPRQIWAFEEISYVAYGTSPLTYTFGRLRRRALLGTNLTNLTGRYGFTVDWAGDGTISQVVDTLNRQLTFTYLAVSDGTGPLLRTVSQVRYRSNIADPNTTTNPVLTFQSADGGTLLERVSKVGALGYTRFRYIANPSGVCRFCGSLMTDVIVPADEAASSPGIFAPTLSTEIALEHNDYFEGRHCRNTHETCSGAANTTGSCASSSPPDPTNICDSDGMLGMASRYPGREYAYMYASNQTVQYDLHQPVTSATCPQCDANSACYNNTCYVANIAVHDTNTRLPTSYGSVGSGNSQASLRSYTSNGAPRSVVDAGGGQTVYGFDSKARVRCMVHRAVRNDSDTEAFVDPLNPETSACAGSASDQIVRVDYNGPCTDGFSICTLKTTASVLSGTVVEEEDFDGTTLLSVRTKVTGQTKNVAGSIVAETHVTTRSYDSIGRVIAVNGPLVDSLAFDKTEISYWASGDLDYGNVFQVKRYVGTQATYIPLTTEYRNYDMWGRAGKVVDPTGSSTNYSTSNQLTWTVTQRDSLNNVLSTSTVALNGDGNVHKAIDADGVCLTFEYSDGTNYVGAPTRIKRSANDTACGAVIDTNSGEVEIRAYMAGEKDRLASVTRKTNGVVEFDYSGFQYDVYRRLKSAATVNSTSPFAFSYTDVLATGVTAPQGPGLGTWRTEQTVDQFARPSALQRYIDSNNKLTHSFGYSSPFSARPTSLTRGYNGATTSTSTFDYDDFGRLIQATVPEAGAPGAAAPTRYEYDVAGRLTKQLVGVGTPLERLDVTTYDSLGRVVLVDHDAAPSHQVNCATAPAGTPIQDEEYRYDDCIGDLPPGVACNNALGRLTIARAILQCGTGVVVKRGRWYNYDAAGRVASVSYATVTGSTIGTAATMTYSYTSEGRIQQYTSPINSAYGTKYTYGATGKVAQIDTSEAVPQLIANAISYWSFGPLASLTANASDGTRTLKYDATYYNEGELNTTNWRLQGSASIALVYQNLSYTPAGLINNRYDFGDLEARRYYEYDSLLRLKCEARGQSSTNTSPDTTHCTTTSPLAAALFTYGNGELPTSPPDVRMTQFLRSEFGTYVSPSSETATYSSGSSQVQQVGSLVLGHDALGRRSYEYNNFDSTRSRRDYTYLPNGQLGTISGRNSSSTQVATSVRYDERGRPVTISESVGGTPRDSYELFWDDGDRLIGVNIAFNPGHVCGSRPSRFGPQYNVCTGARWHYHYLGNRLIAATREMVGGGSSTWQPLKRFYALSDERGLVYRMLDQAGSTFWQARWDASGMRNWVGTPQPEMWVPFGLPGQIVLDRNVVYDNAGPTTSETWGTRAYASGTGGTWTRPAIALNRWRAYDPLLGGFVQPDPLDNYARLDPEGYAYGRNRFVDAFDANGANSDKDLVFVDREVPWGGNAGWAGTNTESCSPTDVVALTASYALAEYKISTCTAGLCRVSESLKRKWLNALYMSPVSCPKTLDFNFIPIGVIRDGFGWDSRGATAARTWVYDVSNRGSEYYPRTIEAFWLEGSDCLASTIAHERLHTLFHPFASGDLGINPSVPMKLDGDYEEQLMHDAVWHCFDCVSFGGLDWQNMATAPKGLFK